MLTLEETALEKDIRALKDIKTNLQEIKKLVTINNGINEAEKKISLLKEFEAKKSDEFGLQGSTIFDEVEEEKEKGEKIQKQSLEDKILSSLDELKKEKISLKSSKEFLWAIGEQVSHKLLDRKGYVKRSNEQYIDWFPLEYLEFYFKDNKTKDFPQVKKVELEILIKFFDQLIECAESWCKNYKIREDLRSRLTKKRENVLDKKEQAKLENNLNDIEKQLSLGVALTPNKLFSLFYDRSLSCIKNILAFKIDKIILDKVMKYLEKTLREKGSKNKLFNKLLFDETISSIIEKHYKTYALLKIRDNLEEKILDVVEEVRNKYILIKIAEIGELAKHFNIEDQKFYHLRYFVECRSLIYDAYQTRNKLSRYNKVIKNNTTLLKEIYESFPKLIPFLNKDSQKDKQEVFSNFDANLYDLCNFLIVPPPLEKEDKVFSPTERKQQLLEFIDLLKKNCDESNSLLYSRLFYSNFGQVVRYFFDDFPQYKLDLESKQPTLYKKLDELRTIREHLCHDRYRWSEEKNILKSSPLVDNEGLLNKQKLESLKKELTQKLNLDLNDKNKNVEKNSVDFLTQLSFSFK